MGRLKNHQFTKAEIKKVISMWDKKTKEQIADELNINEQQVNYIAMQIRKAGYKLTKKHKVGYLRNLITEVINELE